MKKALIVILLLLLTLTVYPQQKRKPAAKKSLPVAIKASPKIDPPKIDTCYSSALKDSPELNGFRLGAQLSDVSAANSLESVTAPYAKDGEAYWRVQKNGIATQLIFYESVLREIRADVMMPGQFKDADEFASSVSKRMGIPDKWADFETSPEYFAELHRVNEALLNNNTKQIDFIGEQDTHPGKKKLLEEKKALEKEREGLVNRIEPIRYQSCIRFDVYAGLIDKELTFIRLLVTQR